MKRKPLFLTPAFGLVVALLLGGCLGGAADLPLENGEQDTSAAAKNTPSWTSQEFSWNGTLESAAVRLEVTDAKSGDCTFVHGYLASASAPGWDAFIAVESHEDTGWYFSGSNWRDARVHAGGVLDSSDFMEPYRADGWMQTEWSTAPFVGDLVIHAGAFHLIPDGDAATFRFSLKCTGDARISQVWTGDEGVLFSAASVSGGAGATGRAVLVGGGVTVRSGGEWDTKAPHVGLVLAGFSQNVGRFEVTGPGGLHEVLIEPAVDPFAGFYHSATLHAPGRFSYVLDEMAGSQGVNGAMLGLSLLEQEPPA